MAKGKRRGHDAGHENHERWLLTYADMITLLVAFFIMLYAMSVMNVTKFQQLALSVRSGFGSSMTNGTPTIMNAGGGVNGRPSIVQSGQTKNNDQNDDGKSSRESQFIPMDVPSPNLKKGEDDRRLDDLTALLKKVVADHKLDGKVQVIVNERGIIIRLLTDKMLFESGKADMRSDEMSLLDNMANLIRTKIDNQVEVEGHTDNRPIHTERYPSNWELSTMRASIVLRYLAQRGVREDRLRAAGYADQRPVALNDTVDGRSRNRRVDIVILRKFGT